MAEEVATNTKKGTNLDLQMMEAYSNTKDDSVSAANNDDNNNSNIWLPDTPHDIELSVTVQYIGNISVVNETFDARLWIDVFWLPSQDELDNKDNNDDPVWNMESNLQTPTAISVDSFDIKKQPKIKDVKGRMMYHGVVQIAGTFSSPFDMHSFPFDSQRLYIILEMGNIKSMMYRPAKHLDSVLSIEKQYCVLSEWDFKDCNISFTASDASLSKQGNRYSQCIIQLILPRNWISFVERYLIVIALLTICVIAVYSIDYGDVGDRLGYIFTLLLTTVAFAFIISEQLPPTSYMTFFDQYYISCNFIVFLNILTCSLAPTMIDSWNFEAFDDICFALTAVSLVLLHIVFFVNSFKAREDGLARVSNVDLDGSKENVVKNIKVSKKHWAQFPGETDDRFVTYKSE